MQLRHALAICTLATTTLMSNAYSQSTEPLNPALRFDIQDYEEDQMLFVASSPISKYKGKDFSVQTLAADGFFAPFHNHKIWRNLLIGFRLGENTMTQLKSKYGEEILTKNQNIGGSLGWATQNDEYGFTGFSCQVSYGANSYAVMDPNNPLANTADEIESLYESGLTMGLNFTTIQRLWPKASNQNPKAGMFFTTAEIAGTPSTESINMAAHVAAFPVPLWNQNALGIKINALRQNMPQITQSFGSATVQASILHGLLEVGFGVGAAQTSYDIDLGSDKSAVCYPITNIKFDFAILNGYINRRR